MQASSVVYLAQSRRNPDWFAIGQSRDVIKRIKGLNREVTGLGWHLVAYIETDNASSLRAELVRKYQDKSLRIHTGWFRLTPEDVEQFKSRGSDDVDRVGGADPVLKAKSVPCADCGTSYPPYVMDMDHLPGSEKKFNIAEWSQWSNGGWSLKELEEELAKCEAVCANCHRTRTHTRNHRMDVA